jgi:putative flippase GtrA
MSKIGEKLFAPEGVSPDKNTSVIKRFVHWVRHDSFKVIGKYGLTSVIATTVDFLTSYICKYPLAMPSLWSTVTGRSLGALIAFLLHRHWVFIDAEHIKISRLIMRYLAGIALSMFLNVAGTEILYKTLGIEYMISRFLTAVSVWAIVFIFNRKVVFKQE